MFNEGKTVQNIFKLIFKQTSIQTCWSTPEVERETFCLVNPWDVVSDVVLGELHAALDLGATSSLSPPEDPGICSGARPKAPAHSSTPEPADPQAQPSWSEVVRRGRKKDAAEVSPEPPLPVSNRYTILSDKSPPHSVSFPAAAAGPPVARTVHTTRRSATGKDRRKILKEAEIRRSGGLPRASSTLHPCSEGIQEPTPSKGHTLDLVIYSGLCPDSFETKGGLGASGPERLRDKPSLFFALALTSYLFTIFVNVTLVVTVFLDKALHQPLYVFLCNLCFNGLCGASSFYPKLLHDLLAADHVVTYAGCLTQVFVVYNYVFCEFTSLTVMAYDRYLAICRPLQYGVLMPARRVAQLLLLTWCFSLLETAAGVALTASLPLCGRHIKKMFCTNWEVVKLSCIDTTFNNIYGFVLMFSHLSQTGLILVSYTHLVRASLRLRSDSRKFVQTCVPHLATLLIFTASLMFDIMYSRYGSGKSLQSLQNAIAAEFLVVPPLINPIIYGINLHQIRTSILHNFSHKPESLRALS
ncbi:LOW QUALITY PROTEIN: olfactory receptor 2G6-like [Anoplopoma fimbria]|uniref:LOW QUALITY PROTEIN: olfactory receptor 2G6-like n=1 Tax=Anoplopoma fimbria TaxID=229290 RepID=UPI0023EC8089|nr:LOW QUALITY PROTEIN: olfactory receptor 2G6-like [Anoplopoma fimbria]